MIKMRRLAVRGREGDVAEGRGFQARASGGEGEGGTVTLS